MPDNRQYVTGNENKSYPLGVARVVMALDSGKAYESFSASWPWAAWWRRVFHRQSLWSLSRGHARESNVLASKDKAVKPNRASTGKHLQCMAYAIGGIRFASSKQQATCVWWKAVSYKTWAKWLPHHRLPVQRYVWSVIRSQVAKHLMPLLCLNDPVVQNVLAANPRGPVTEVAKYFMFLFEGHLREDSGWAVLCRRRSRLLRGWTQLVVERTLSMTAASRDWFFVVCGNVRI